MKKAAGMLGAGLAGATMLAWFASSAAGASSSSQKWRLGPSSSQASPVSEPVSIAVLGAGLVVLGLIAKKKMNKKT